MAEVGVGYRVLLVGLGHGELAAYFDSLGISCAGIDESPANVMEARRAAATCEFTCASVGDPFPGPKAGFDLVLVRDASVFQTSLLSSTALSSTLQLAARLRPGGRLAFLGRIGEGAASRAHGLSCYTRHFRSLPWRCDLHELPDGLGLGRSFRVQPATQVGSGYAIAVLRLPSERLSQQDWAHLADAGVSFRGGVLRLGCPRVRLGRLPFQGGLTACPELPASISHSPRNELQGLRCIFSFPLASRAATSTRPN